jgi:branched-chain amino acid transport system permease protein
MGRIFIDNFRHPNKYLPLTTLLLLTCIPVFIRDVTVLNILVYTFLFAYYSGSWSIIGKYAGQISLGHAIFFGVGGYITVWLYIYCNISPWLGMLVGGLISGLLAMPIGFVCFRLKGLFFILATFGFAQIIYIIFLTPLAFLSGGAQGIPFALGYESVYAFQFISKIPFYYITLIMMVLLSYGLYTMEKSKFGYYLKAICEDEDAASSIGIHTLKYKLFALFVSSFLTALAGSVYVQFLTYVSSDDVFHVSRSITPIVISWVGGSGFFGPVLGSFVVVPITQLLVNLLGGLVAPGFHQLIYGAILILMVRFAPEGIIGAFVGKFYNPLVEKLLKKR